MADVVTPQPPLLANFNYDDIADGTGTVILHAWAGRTDDNTLFYKLGPELTFSEITELTVANGGPDTTATFYSGKFNVPKVLNGDCIVSWYWFTSNSNFYGDYILSLYHYRGTTSTQIGSTATRTQADNEGSRSQNVLFTADNIKFKRGDQLKLELAFNINDGGYGAIAIDPMNSDGTYIKPQTTTAHANSLKVRLPFRIDR